MFGKPKKEMERRIEEYECAESSLLLKTFQGIRQKLIQRELTADKQQQKQIMDKKKVQTKGAPPIFLV